MELVASKVTIKIGRDGRRRVFVRSVTTDGTVLEGMREVVTPKDVEKAVLDIRHDHETIDPKEAARAHELAVAAAKKQAGI